MAASNPPPDVRARRQYNWFRAYTVMPRNPKIAALSDAEFRAYVYALCSAREEQIRGEWIDGSYVSAALGPTYSQHVPALVEKKLLDVEDDGTVRVPQWGFWQTEDPTGAKRQADYRARHRVTVTSSDSNLEEEEEGRHRHREEEAEPLASPTAIPAWAASWSANWHPFLSKWTARGFGRITDNQRSKLLYTILDERPAFLLRVVDEIPKDHPDPIGYVKDADRRRGEAGPVQATGPTRPSPVVSDDPTCFRCGKEIAVNDLSDEVVVSGMMRKVCYANCEAAS